MNKNFYLATGAVLLAVVAGVAGNWWGMQHAQNPAPSAVSASAPDTPVKRKIRFYRNPMGLADTSPVPKKDPMGMDYIAVYEDEDANQTAPANELKFSADKVQKLGVRTEAASLRVLDKTVRAAGRVEPDERRSYTIAPKFEGYLEKLYVNATGQNVTKGQPLFEVYSPELISAQREYAIASQGVQSMAQAAPGAQTGMQQLVEASLSRLRNWDISEDQLKELSASAAARRTLTFRSPVTGIVTEKKAIQGMRFMPGDALYQVSDLSQVWIMADVFEQDIAALRVGTRASVKVDSYPGKTFSGALSTIYPTLNNETRTIQVRLELANSAGLLKPGMFAQVEVPVGGKAKVLTVPTSAVIDSGTRQVLLVQTGLPEEGRFEVREVKLGARSDNYLEVLEGVREGEAVVVAANFLIDAESNLKAAIAGFGTAATNSTNGAPAAATDAPPGLAPQEAVSHQGTGKVIEIDAKDLTVTISHGAIASLKWPAMTMDFTLANRALLSGLKPGAAVAFEIVERGKGEWVITSIAPKTPLKAQ